MRYRLGLSLALTALVAPVGAEQSIGEDLYHGRTAAVARLRGHEATLPPAAVVCTNCHEPGPQVSTASVAYAPPLDSRLALALPRRGGPPAAYDEASFCRLLRTGVDPALILVRKAMPQFEIGSAECASLWRYLLQRPPREPAAP